MKKINTSDIVQGVRRMGATKSTLDHLQESYQEAIAEVIKGLTGNAAGVLVLWGCEDSDPDATDWDISAGAIYYNGEVFTVPSFVGSHGSSVPVLSIATAYRAGDPIKFSDNNNYNVHEIRTMSWAMGVSGSGLADFSGLIYLKNLFKINRLEVLNGIRSQASGPYLRKKVVDIGNWDMATNSSVSVAHGLTDFTKIRAVTVIVQNDPSTVLYDLAATRGVANSNTKSGAIVSITSTDVVLQRASSADDGIFDDPAFDSTGFNRGWVTIEYEA